MSQIRDRWVSDDGAVTLLLGDCLEILPTIAQESIDSVVTDPPYGQTNESYDGAHSPALQPEVWRLSAAKPNSCVVSFAGSPTYHKIATAIETAGWKIRQMWGWVYADGLITSAWPKEGFDRLAPACDPIVYATRGKVILPLKREGHHVWRRDPASRGIQSYSDRASGHGKIEAQGQWPRSVFYQARTSAGTGHIDHPNAKPLNLMRWIVGKVPGVVCDPFMGSGTTGVACIQTNHRFIGIESDPKHFETAKQRCQEEFDRLPMFKPTKKPAA